MNQNEKIPDYRLLPGRERGSRSKIEMRGAEDAVDACFLAGGTLAEGREVFRSVTGERISLDALSRHRRRLIRRVEQVEMMALILEKLAEREEQIRKGLITREEVARRVEEAEREILRCVARKILEAERRRLREYCAADYEEEIEDLSPGRDD